MLGDQRAIAAISRMPSAAFMAAGASERWSTMSCSSPRHTAFVAGELAASAPHRELQVHAWCCPHHLGRHGSGEEFRSRAIELADVAETAMRGPSARLAQSGERVRRLPLCDMKEREPAGLAHRLAVAELRSDIDPTGTGQLL